MDLNENITGLQHIGIPTLVIDKTIEFYESLGFKVIQRESLEDGSKVAFLELNKLIIETWENKSNFNEIGVIDHIALDVCDIEAAFKDCKENKLTILNKNIEFLPFWSNGIKHFEIQGVNNEKIEFCQKL